MSYVDFPFGIDERGRTAMVDRDEYIRDLIEQVLLTSPGERVHRPSFGTGLLKYVFEPNSAAVASAVQASAHATLQQWLGDLIQVIEVRVEAIDSTLLTQVVYVPYGQQQAQLAEIRRTV